MHLEFENQTKIAASPLSFTADITGCFLEMEHWQDWGLLTLNI